MFLRVQNLQQQLQQWTSQYYKQILFINIQLEVSHIW